jgi:signal recognition particle receptor subunit beta
VALSLRRRVETDYGPLPFVLLLNKNDLPDQWTITEGDMDGLKNAGWWVRSSSARTGEGVEDAFLDLAVRTVR